MDGREGLGGVSDFLLELLSEEIPARMQARARADLARLFAEELQRAGLSTEGIQTYSTPRRLALIARGLPDTTEAVSEEVKGPRVGAPPQALEGFLKKTGLGREQLEERDGVLFARIERPGRAAGEVLAEAVQAIVRDFPWSKSMRWGAGSLRWVRPLHGIVALLGEDIVPVEVDGIAAGAATVGHRFHHPGVITIGSANDYAEKLRACHVIVDHEEREALIRDGAAKAAAEAGLALVEDEGLVVENAGLTEWPVPLAGQFDPDYLDVPREVTVLTMRTNQKYFACTDEAGVLAPAFVCVANIDANDGGAAIVEGNRRVLAARLADARFFWEQDLKVPLEEQAQKLSGIVFHDKLGTVADKVERVAKLARWLVESGVIKPSPSWGGLGGGPAASAAETTRVAAGERKSPSAADAAGPPPQSSPTRGEGVGQLADLAERAARLAKADLVTGMVGEFPELQGVVGGYLAERQGEPKAVAEAIRDHYKPVGQGDEVPTAPVTVAVALADKLDSLISFFFVREEPSGSRDPFALRRSALGVLAILVSSGVRLPLFSAIGLSITTTRNQMTMRQAVSDVADVTHSLAKLTGDETTGAELTSFIAKGAAARTKVDTSTSDDQVVSAATRVVQFFIDRLKVQQRELGVRHDIVDAVFAVGIEDDVVRLLARVRALQAFVETEEGVNLLAGYKRAANILKKEEGSWTPDQVRGDEIPGEEAALVAALDKAEPKAKAAVGKEDFTAAMAALASLRGPIDSFFDKVTVNVPEKDTRARRLNLLARFRDAVHQVADFSKIEG